MPKISIKRIPPSRTTPYITEETFHLETTAIHNSRLNSRPILNKFPSIVTAYDQLQISPFDRSQESRSAANTHIYYTAMDPSVQTGNKSHCEINRRERFPLSFVAVVLLPSTNLVWALRQSEREIESSRINLNVKRSANNESATSKLNRLSTVV